MAQSLQKNLANKQKFSYNLPNNLRLVAVRKCFAHGLQLSLGLRLSVSNPLRGFGTFFVIAVDRMEIEIETLQEVTIMYLLT
ncbi:MAG: hypothetical protein J6J01_09780, partial [Oscillospiraceae bacterium]|nr:hypothetical protein [Oscillospiraceae bacterium]